MATSGSLGTGQVLVLRTVEILTPEVGRGFLLSLREWMTDFHDQFR
jgi:hypothetical protein